MLKPLRILRRATLLLLSLLAGLALGIFLPVIPLPADKIGDPQGATDKRISAPLADSDLKEILSIVRRGRLSSVYEIVRYHTHEKLLYIQPSAASWVLEPGASEMKQEPPRGKITVTIGTICGTLCGSGITYYLDQRDGSWVVVEKTEWIS